MSDGVARQWLTLRTTVRPGQVRVAIMISSLATVAPFFLDRDLPTGVLASLIAFCAFWSATALTTSVRFQLFRQGAAMVPGLRVRTLASSLSLGLALWLIPLATAALQGYRVDTMASIASVAFGASWFLGPLFPDNQRTALGVLSFAIGVDTLLFFEHTRGTRSFWIEAVDPAAQKLVLLLVAVLLTAWSTHRLARLREDSWVLRRWWNRSRGDCMDCAGSAGLPEWSLDLIPAFMRRRLPDRGHAPTARSSLQRDLFAYSLHVFSPLGMALFYLPFVVVLTALAAGERDETSLFWNPNLFLLNGLIIWFGGLSPSRLRKEWTRPFGRGDLVDGILSALVRNIAVFTGIFLVMSVLVHLSFRASILTLPVYWIGILTAPFLMTLGYGIALWASRWTRWSGLVGFFPAWVLAALAFAMTEDDPSPLVFALCGAGSLGVAGLGWLLGRIGARHWREVEIG